MNNFSSNEKIEKLFSFVNFDTETSDEDQFLTLAMKYINFAYPGEDVSERYTAMSSLLIEPESKKAKKLPKLLRKLRKRMIEILDSIIDPQKESALIELRGKRTISFKEHQMVETFETEKKNTQKIMFPVEKRKMEGSFIDLISNDEIVLKWFKQCQNERCQNYIYEQRKLYCSDRCSNAHRQRRKITK